MSVDDLENAADAVTEAADAIENIEIGDLDESAASGVYNFLTDLGAWETELREIAEDHRSTEESE